MTNIQIAVTDNNTITVIADTKRFGKHAVMYEGSTFMQCCDYIRRATRNNHFKLQALSHPALPIRTFTDPEGRTLPWMMDVVLD